MLLLFWNPTCGHCQVMLPELRAWEERPTTQRPALVVISAGDIEANRALGLSSRILLDEDFTAARAFGVNGTPMAVLVDAKGRIASPVAAGAPAIWRLAGTPASGLPRNEPAIA
jgi:protein-disulfide isomerase